MTCIPVVNEKIRAEVWLGNTLLAKTPFVRSFNVQKSRSQISTTFSLSLEIMGGKSLPLGQKITIKAGLRDNLKDIFTGEIETTSVKPSFGKPSYFLISLNGRGVLSILEGKTFSRRLPANSEGIYCKITGGSSNAVDSFKTLDKRVESGNRTITLPTPSLSKGTGENSPLIVHNAKGTAEHVAGPVGRLTSQPSSAGEDKGETGEGLGIHDHSSMAKGGPAFATYVTS